MLDHRLREKSVAGRVALYCGVAVISIVFLVQFEQFYGGKTFTLTEDQQAAYSKSSVPTMGIIAGGIGLCLYGIHRLLDSWEGLGIEAKSAIQKAKSAVAKSVRARPNLFWLVMCAYAAVFALASGIIIPSAQSFSSRYGVAVPSYYVTGCCGQPGAFPVVTIYLSQNIGLLLTPLDLILVVFLPLLVSMNVTTMVQRASSISLACKVSREPSVYGASAGLMAACPTCAASIFLASSASASIFGVSAATLAALQPAFLVTSIGLLIAAPVIAQLQK